MSEFTSNNRWWSHRANRKNETEDEMETMQADIRKLETRRDFLRDQALELRKKYHGIYTGEVPAYPQIKRKT
jgi:hypothetical protein